MLTEVPWPVWLVAFGPTLAMVWGCAWGAWGPDRMEGGGRYARSWRRWHRASVIAVVIQGPGLTFLFAFMLAASDRDMAMQRHRALETVKTARSELAVMQSRLETQKQQLDTQQPILEALAEWKLWHKAVESRIEALRERMLYQPWAEEEWKRQKAKQK